MLRLLLSLRYWLLSHHLLLKLVLRLHRLKLLWIHGLLLLWYMLVLLGLKMLLLVIQLLL